MKEREAPIHFELYRVIKELISEGITIHGITFSKIEPKLRLDSGLEADLVLIDNLGKKWLVIETKRLDEGRKSKLFDPFSPIVIKQAYDYAGELGAPTFATCNRNTFVLFNTFEEFKSLSQRKVMHYDLKDKDLKTILRQILYVVVTSQIKPEEIKWTPDYEVLIARLRTLHELISPFITKEFFSLLKNKDFNKKYINWLEKQGFEDNNDRREIIAKETAYLLMNKIIFYKTIEAQYGLPQLEKIITRDLREGLKKYFDKVINEIDFEAVFEQEELFDRIPFSDEVRKITNEFIEELKYYNFSELHGDILGMVYRNLIPKDEKKRFGQYYTDAHICELIARLCIQNPDDIILDPACGSGTFLIQAYNRIKELKLKENPLQTNEQVHNKILKQLYGIEINQFPAHLSVMQITMQNPKAKSNKINILVNDFFKVHQKGLVIHKTINLGKKERTVIIPSVNVVIGNPPYIRQEAIKDKKWIRNAALIDCKNLINEKSDIYIYFFTYGLSFLRNNGKFGFITSNSWLDVGFGEGLKKFFLNTCKIKTIIAFDTNVFEDALANTCITILEKTNGEINLRDKNLVKFVRIKKPLDINEIITKIKKYSEDFEDNNIKIIPIAQKELSKETKWGRFHKAPAIFWKLLKNPKLTRLSDGKTTEISSKQKNLGKEKEERVVYVKRCITTNANEFFIIPKEVAKEWGIEKEYLKPVATSPKDLKSLITKSKDIRNYMLVVEEPKIILKQNKKNVLKYIEHGERTRITLKRGKTAGEEIIGYNNIPSFKNKKDKWYMIEKVKPAPILMPSMYWDKYPVFLNKGNLYATHNFYEILPLKKENTLVLLGFLNCSLTPLFMELYGRIPGGRTLEIMVYEVEQLPILDPNKLTKVERKKIEKAFLDLVKAQKQGKAEKEARRKLDNVIFDILGLEIKERNEVYDGLEELKKIRKGGLIRVKKSKIRSSGIRKRRGLMKENVQMTSLHKWLSN